ncbi:MAG: FHA domain-containing protein [Verrucomicrobiota bacterium]
MQSWIKKFIAALDDEPKTLLITFYNARGTMDWCFQQGFIYQLSGPDKKEWKQYFSKDDVNMAVRTVSWWDHEPLSDGTIDEVLDILGTTKPTLDSSPTKSLIEEDSPPPPPPPKQASLQKKTTVPVGQIRTFSKAEVGGDSSPTTAIPEAYLQRRAGSVPYLYVDPTSSQPYWIGRQEPCDTVINDLSISRKHCQIFARNGSLILSDSGSANGSYVNEQRVEGEIEVKPGDLVRVGRAMFILRHTNTD